MRDTSREMGGLCIGSDSPGTAGGGLAVGIILERPMAGIFGVGRWGGCEVDGRGAEGRVPDFGEAHADADAVLGRETANGETERSAGEEGFSALAYVLEVEVFATGEVLLFADEIGLDRLALLRGEGRRPERTEKNERK